MQINYLQTNNYNNYNVKIHINNNLDLTSNIKSHLNNILWCPNNLGLSVSKHHRNFFERIDLSNLLFSKLKHFSRLLWTANLDYNVKNQVLIFLKDQSCFSDFTVACVIFD